MKYTETLRKPPVVSAFFIKENLTQDFNVEIVDKSYDGILGVKFSHESTDYTFSFLSVTCPQKDQHAVETHKVSFLIFCLKCT